MKKKIHIKTIKLIFAVLCLCFVQSLNGQATSQWRSAATGSFANATGNVWEKYNTVTFTWDLQIAGAKPSGSSNVTIRNGHTVTIDASPTTVSMLNLTIEAGGTLNSAVSAPAGIGMRLGVSSAADVTAGYTNNVVTLTNNGTLGSTTATGDGINLEVGTNCASLTVTGTGTTRINRFRPLQNNPNNPTTITFNHNVDLTIANNYAFTATQNSASNSSTENIVVNINAGKTVKIVNAGGFFHGSVSATTPQSNTSGTYTYNINGTLDLSATTSGGLQSSSTGTASLNLNIKNGGVMKLGTAFSAYKASATNGSINMTIESGGTVDGSLLTSGITNSSSTLGTGATWFTIQSGGVLKQAVGATSVTFPIGTDATHYNPVTLTNGGGNVFTATVSTGNAPAGLTDATKALNRTWNITPTTTPATADISFGYNTGDGNASCVLTDGMDLLHHNGTAWEKLGSATPSVPSSGTTNYQAGYTGVTNFSPFTLGNVGALPIELISFNAYAKGSTNILNWSTATERNNREFAIERSLNGVDFDNIGSVKGSGNSSVVRNYTFTDKVPPLSIAYYRLRQIDFDGIETVSKAITVSRNGVVKVAISKVYPSVTTDYLTLDLSTNGNTSLTVSDLMGRVISTKSLGDNVGTLIQNLDVSQLAKGLYFVTLQSGGTRLTEKFEKQ
jgi:Secretion system C-terminal sorting domain